MAARTVGSLFSGIGGLDLGLERAGWEVKWQVEIDEWCRRVLTKHWPKVPKYGDVRKLRGEQLESVDLITGGFPCQPISLAGRREAQADSRWLWPEFLRIVSALRPRFVLVENVPGLLYRGMAEIISDLSSCGYDAEWDCISAAAFGAPHRRERVFIVAYTSGNGCRSWPSGDLECDKIHSAQRCFGIGLVSEEMAEADTLRNSWWAIEPDVGRVAYGLPSRMDRFRGLGNAVVPQIAEWIGQRLLDM